MSFMPKPHVSAALRHLRRSVTVCALSLGCCLLLHTLVWAFVHFTDVRWTSLEPASGDHVPVVIRPEPGSQTPPKSLAASKAAQDAAPAPISGLPAPVWPAGTNVPRTVALEPADPNIVPSRAEMWLKHLSGLTQSFGVVSAIVLAALMFQGVVIAGGSSVPGVERVVTASSWTLVVALFCLPLSQLLPAMPYSGVFTSYGSLTAVSELLRSNDPAAPSGFVFYCQNLFIPLLMMILVTLAALRFHSGVEQGVIVTSVSELDAKIEQEMKSIKLAATASPRAVGALHRAIGEDVNEVASSLTRPSRNGIKVEADRAERVEAAAGRMGKPVPGDPLKRPI